MQCRHGPCLQNVYGLVSREVSSTILLATWVLLCYAAKREKKSLGCFGNHCTETKKKKKKNQNQRGFRKRHFKLNISNSSSFLLFPQSCPCLRILCLSTELCHLLSCSRQNAKNILIPLYLSSAPPY